MKMSSSNYFIKGPSETENSVELWSNERIQFPPKGWQFGMRNELKSRIAELKSGENTVLYAVYSSEIQDFVDTENVLFYNVGPSAFKHLCQTGLYFERNFDSPHLMPKNTIKSPKHYQYYKVGKKTEVSKLWKKDKTIACWIDVPAPPLTNENKPHEYWYAMKKGDIQTTYPIEVPRKYGIRLEIKGPKGTIINLASSIKQPLDGIICAFHSHNGTNISRISKLLANPLNENPLNIESLLMENESAILGKLNLLYPRANFVQWNPADDTCLSAEIEFKGISEDNWFITGEIYTIKR